MAAAMAVEDARILARALAATDDVPAALAAYQAARIPRTTRIVTGSAANRPMLRNPDREALRQSFARCGPNAERTAWLFACDPATEPLAA
jgi:salicylate hydroxylase